MSLCDVLILSGYRNYCFFLCRTRPRFGINLYKLGHANNEFMIFFQCACKADAIESNKLQFLFTNYLV